MWKTGNKTAALPHNRLLPAMPDKAPQAIASLGQLPCKGRLLRGHRPRERLPFQGRWPRSRPEGLFPFAPAANFFLNF